MYFGRPDAGGALNKQGVLKALPRYVDVVNKKRYARYLLAKSYQADYRRSDETDVLWKIHDSLLSEFKEFQKQIDQSSRKPRSITRSFMGLEVLLAHKVVQSCRFCERNCDVNRLRGEKGYCGAGRNFSLFSAFPHMGEEPELVPSGTIFTGGCTIRCLHCQNWDISQWKSSGSSVTPEAMTIQVRELAERGCRNINMVGGDPTPVTWQWLETMNMLNVNIATVWNSNSYYSVETSKLLAGFIDLYLLDFKYGNNKCAEEISGAQGYWEAATRNNLTAYHHGELIVRVLVLPGHNECCTRPILRWISDNLGPWTRVNLMFQYRPEWRAHERKDLGRSLTPDEIAEAKKIANDVGLKNLVL